MTEGVLDPDERDAVARMFGVGEAQVVRDHLISHALAAIAADGVDDVIFFGGTALSRTLLPSLRLSEDIDLIAMQDRKNVAGRIERALTRRLSRRVGIPTFEPALSRTSHAEPATMEAGGARVQIQLVSSAGYPVWPTEVVEIEQRYSDAPAALLRVLTPAAFAAAKLSSWGDRAAPRDLYDLWALANAGYVDHDAAMLFACVGSYTSAANVPFDRLPTDTEWHRSLGHQCRPQVGPKEAAQVVSRSWAAATAAASDRRRPPR